MVWTFVRSPAQGPVTVTVVDSGSSRISVLAAVPARVVAAAAGMTLGPVIVPPAVTFRIPETVEAPRSMVLVSLRVTLLQLGRASGWEGGSFSGVAVCLKPGANVAVVAPLTLRPSGMQPPGVIRAPETALGAADM